MLPARLARLHPANEGLFIGLRLSAAKQGLAGAEAGASSTAPTTPPPPPPPPLTQTTPHACSGLALSPRSRLLVSAVLNCRQQLKRARARASERACREGRESRAGLLSCYLTSLDSKVCVPAVKSWLCISGFYEDGCCFHRMLVGSHGALARPGAGSPDDMKES